MLRFLVILAFVVPTGRGLRGGCKLYVSCKWGYGVGADQSAAALTRHASLQGRKPAEESLSVLFTFSCARRSETMLSCVNLRRGPQSGVVKSLLLGIFDTQGLGWPARAADAFCWSYPLLIHTSYVCVQRYSWSALAVTEQKPSIGTRDGL